MKLNVTIRQSILLMGSIDTSYIPNATGLRYIVVPILFNEVGLSVLDPLFIDINNNKYYHDYGLFMVKLRDQCSHYHIAYCSKEAYAFYIHRKTDEVDIEIDYNTDILDHFIIKTYTSEDNDAIDSIEEEIELCIKQ